ncbi:hypothetical protein LXL04_021307 [Taraxacum kok-saghyz]
MRGSQLYTALFFPSLEFFPTGFSLARYINNELLANGAESIQTRLDLAVNGVRKADLKPVNTELAAEDLEVAVVMKVIYIFPAIQETQEDLCETLHISKSIDRIFFRSTGFDFDSILRREARIGGFVVESEDLWNGDRGEVGLEIREARIGGLQVWIQESRGLFDVVSESDAEEDTNETQDLPFSHYGLVRYPIGKDHQQYLTFIFIYNSTQDFICNSSQHHGLNTSMFPWMQEFERAVFLVGFVEEIDDDDDDEDAQIVELERIMKLRHPSVIFAGGVSFAETGELL